MIGGIGSQPRFVKTPAPGALTARPPRPPSPQLPAANNSIIYSKEKYATVQEFTSHDDFEAFKSEYSESINSVISFVQDNADQVIPPLTSSAVANVQQKLNIFERHILDSEADFFSSHKEIMFGTGKELLHEFDHLLKNEKIPLQKRMNAVLEMAPQMPLCAGGVVTVLTDGVSCLKASTAGLTGAAQALKKRMAASLILDFIKNAHPGYNTGNEIHYVNAYLNHVASDLGLSQSNDPFIDSVRRDITPAHVEACKTSILGKLNPSLLSVQIANDYMMKVKGAQKPGVDVTQPFSSEQIGDVLNGVFSIKQVELDQDFGDVPIDTIFRQDENDRYGYRFPQKQDLLARHFMMELKNEGAVDFDDADTLATLDDDLAEQKVKMLGDIFWRENTESMVEVRSSDFFAIQPEEIFHRLRNKYPSFDAKDHGIAFENMSKHIFKHHAVERINSIPYEWFDGLATLVRSGVISREQAVPALHLAAATGSAGGLSALINSGVKTNAVDSEGNTAMHFAATHDRRQSLQVLLMNGASRNTVNRRGDTPLRCAAQNNSIDAARFLLGVSSRVDITRQSIAECSLRSPRAIGRHINADSPRWTNLLTEAARSGSADVLKLFIWAGGQVNRISSPGGDSPLGYAVDGNKELAARVLIDAGADVNFSRNGECLVLRAARKGNEAIMQALINANANPNPNLPGGDTVLMEAAAHDHGNVVKLLVKAGLNPNQANLRGFTAVHIAAEANSVNAIQALIDAQANLEARCQEGWTPLHAGAANRSLNATKALIDAKVDLEAVGLHGWTALHVAASINHGDAIKELLAASASADQRTEKGSTALHLAAARNHADAVTALLEGRARRDDRTLEGWTALHLAASKNHADVVKILLQGEDPDHKTTGGLTALQIARSVGANEARLALREAGAHRQTDVPKGWTAVHIAASRGSDNDVKALIASGASLDTLTPDGRTALHIATAGGHEHIVSELMGAGADRSLQTPDGLTALQIAVQNKHDNIVRLLREPSVQLAG